MFETFEHKADVGVRGLGKTREEAFEETAKAMFSIMCDLKKVKQKKEVDFVVMSSDLEALLVEFLNELLYHKDTKETMFSSFKIKISETGNDYKLECKAKGEKTSENQGLKTEVKAASYSQLKVSEEKEKWLAQCIVDV